MLFIFLTLFDQYFRDAGIGPGPLRAIFSRAIRQMVHNGRYWIQTTRDGYYTPLVSGLPLSIEDLGYYGICGAMIRMALLWSQDLIPISPLFLALVLGTWDEATNPLFLHAVAPALAQRLATWPPQRVPDAPGSDVMVNEIRLGEDPMNMVMEIIPNAQVLLILYNLMRPQGMLTFILH